MANRLHALNLKSWFSPRPTLLFVASLKPYLRKTLIMIKDKNTNEGKRVQQTLSIHSHGKTQWEKTREEYQKLLMNLLFYNIEL